MSSIFFSQGYFWQVVEGLHRPALLILTLFQSSIYKVNVREYPPRGFMSWKRTTLNSMMAWHEEDSHWNIDVFVFFSSSPSKDYDEYVLGFFFTICWSLNLWMMFSLLKRDCKSLCVCGSSVCVYIQWIKTSLKLSFPLFISASFKR